jgi:hypothetical protein
MIESIQQFDNYELQLAELLNSLRSCPVAYQTSIRVAGVTFAISGNSSKFRDFIEPSFRHLMLPLGQIGEGNFELILFEGMTVGDSPPQMFWERVFSEHLPAESIRPQLFVTENFRICYLSNLGIVFGLDFKNRRMFYWTENLKLLALSEYCSPLRLNFLWWAHSTKSQLLHAGSVGTDRGAVIIVGPGGKGKSTLSVAASAYGGFEFLGDDSIIASNDPIPMVHSLYSSAKLDLRSLNEFPELRFCVNQDLQTDKHFLELSRTSKIKVSRSLPIKAVIVPCFGRDKNYDLRPISAATAGIVLVPSTTVYSLGVERDSFTFSNKLVSSLPCFAYEYESTHRAGELLRNQLSEVGIEL